MKRKKCPFGCDGYVTAVAAGQSQSQRLYSGVGIFNCARVRGSIGDWVDLKKKNVGVGLIKEAP